MNSGNLKPIEILLVEDNPGDVRLAQEAFSEAKIQNHLNVVNDGVDALAYLHQEGIFSSAPHADLIMLDINLPRKNGLEVLTEIKDNETLRRIPVVIFTTSKSESDIMQSYDLQASCYVTKPIDFDEFMNVMHTIEDFWLSTVKLPSNKD